MARTLRLLIIFFVLVTCVGCDQVAKSVAREALVARPPIHVLDGLLRLQYMENPGAFLSLGAGLPAPIRTLLLVVVAGGMLAVFLGYILRTGSLNTIQLIGASLLVAGGLGNMVDRIFRGGAVVDFAVLSVGPLHTGVFNVADLAIVAGVVVFACSHLARPAGTA